MPGKYQIIACAVTVGLFGLAAPAQAASPPVGDPHTIHRFEFDRGETPENITLEPDGAADESLAFAAQVVRISLNGRQHLLARLPSSSSTVCQYAQAHAVALGIVRDRRGTLYTALCTGSADLQGVWRIDPDGKRSRIAALPPEGFPNGMAFDQDQRYIYVTDSLLSTVWRVAVADGRVTVWATGSKLAPSAGKLGVNGVKVHDHAVWVTNSQGGTLLRIPIRHDGTAGNIKVIARHLPGIDDFAFTGPRPSAAILATINTSSEVALIKPNGTHTIVLTADDGLSNPSSIAIKGRTIYVNSAAYDTRTNPDTPPPNLLLARLGH